MKKLYSFFISTLLVSSAVCAGGTDYTKGLAIWFDAPNTLQGHAVWYGGRPDMWKGENKPETAGDTARNPDAAWGVTIIAYWKWQYRGEYYGIGRS